MKARLVAVFALLALMLVDPNTAAEKIVLVAGGGTSKAGGPANEAAIGQPFGMSHDKVGNLFIADYSEHRVWKVDPAGVISVAAGTGRKGFAGDGGPATQGQFDGIHDLVVAPNGDIYIADSYNLRVRRIDTRTGSLSTIAGNGEKKIAGDGGPGEKASLDGVASLWIAGDKHYMTGFSGAVRLLDLKTGIAGSGKKGKAGLDGPPLATELNGPHAVYFHPATRAVYIGDSRNKRVLKIVL